jgi:hypothetical protein
MACQDRAQTATAAPIGIKRRRGNDFPREMGFFEIAWFIISDLYCRRQILSGSIDPDFIYPPL